MALATASRGEPDSEGRLHTDQALLVSPAALPEPAAGDTSGLSLALAGELR